MSDTKRPFPLDQFAGGLIAVGLLTMEAVTWVAYMKMVAATGASPYPEANPLVSVPLFLAMLYIAYGIFRGRHWAFVVFGLFALTSVIRNFMMIDRLRDFYNLYGITGFYAVAFLYCAVRAWMTYAAQGRSVSGDTAA